MVVMALDHCRDFFSVTTFRPEDVAVTTPAWFATRWITHFCAPLFVFLSGTSAWLYRQNRSISKGELSIFLISRGVWLIVVEIVILGALLHFGGYPFLFLQVIWVIGISMIVLGVLIYLPTSVIAILSLVLVGGHNLLDSMPINSGNEVPLYWQLLHVQGFSPSPFPTIVAYPLLPWPGVMALGYVFGRVLQNEPVNRDRICLVIGCVCVFLFVALRLTNLYGEPSGWASQERGAIYTFMSFLNTTKYPPSLLFLLMTIGPGIISLPLLEKMNGFGVRAFECFGRVPFMYYIMHWVVIRSASYVWLWLQYRTTDNLVFTNPATWPDSYEPSLLRTYAAWLLVVLLLYPFCVWYQKFKSQHRNWKLLSYL